MSIVPLWTQYPGLQAVERECYPTLREMYAELARSTPRPLLESPPMSAADALREQHRRVAQIVARRAARVMPRQATNGTEPC